MWLGKLPEWYKLWMDSIKHNQEFNWLLICDNIDDEFKNYKNDNKINNLTTFNLSKSDLYNLIKSKCDIDINQNFKPYKLCDFRPLYGKIFSHLLEDYDFWGWGDIDVVYGNLSKKINDTLLDNYDVIGTGMSDRCSGPLCFFKNINKINELYKKLPYELFKGGHKSVDENAFSALVRKSANIKSELSNKEQPLHLMGLHKAADGFLLRAFVLKWFAQHYPKMHQSIVAKRCKITVPKCPSLPIREASNKDFNIYWYKGVFYDEKNTPLDYTHFHFGGSGTRVKLRKNLILSIKNIKFPTEGIKFQFYFFLLALRDITEKLITLKNLSE